ncbi:dTDP-glucose 4,6-dehydratase [Paenibacillus sp. V4I3]|uniref:dTDP-glucose 4,6-dehydratase n=1 Tax=unclassified Paenibacillus TaxID=185978 RepID=UPI002785E612|nr:MULTISPECIES: dTDP-glucose 4,6-dehydratase [unclassified Paenibacillus]MDQ0873215.1 dTDP-glucose 4,6-dehydratase [Paenibacillus sp. V4I3]MDQ0890868.1 dTDP-glucose 4,6-dehydratase [Paenibacillus sp. V4I9]
MNILVTGGAGFIGSNFIRYMLSKYSDYFIVNLDKLTYAGNLDNLKEVENSLNYTFIRGNIGNRELVANIVEMYNVDAIVNFAAESHVDRSIMDPEVFTLTNVLGTQVLLDVAKELKVKRFVQISTDEVYGSLEETGLFTEQTPIAPNSPYSASKASADLLVQAYHETYGLHTNITRCSNNYGPFHYPEKLIPLMITNALEDKKLPVYGDGLNVRDWLHVSDHAAAIDLVLHQGEAGEVYNIGGNNEHPNIEIVELILEALGKSNSLVQFVQDRLGHDRRYAIDASKIRRELGWVPQISFQQGIKDTIVWYLENPQWWQDVKARAYSSI